MKSSFKDKRFWKLPYILATMLLGVIAVVGLFWNCTQGSQKNGPDQEHKYEFNSRLAIRDVEYQVNLGPRVPGSKAHQKTVQWITNRMIDSGWTVDIQEDRVGEVKIENIVARTGQGHPWLLIGAHYDSRLLADRDPDPDKRSNPVPGANDGASGVAVLLELARILPGIIQSEDLVGEIWLVFFDTEDNGDIGQYKWIMGSETFVSSLSDFPDAVVILDMVGDAELDIYKEKNSHPELAEEIWDVANSLGYGKYFLPEYKHSILDDHVPFRNAGVRAVDVIDFNYPYWHTTSDTADKISADSLQAVGHTILVWLQNSLVQE